MGLFRIVDIFHNKCESNDIAKDIIMSVKHPRFKLTKSTLKATLYFGKRDSSVLEVDVLLDDNFVRLEFSFEVFFRIFLVFGFLMVLGIEAVALFFFNKEVTENKFGIGIIGILMPLLFLLSYLVLRMKLLGRRKKLLADFRKLNVI